MWKVEKHTLDNGLTVLIHPDPTSPVGVLNLLYDVGARDERPQQTGFAHLFEHLMFGGSQNIPDFDMPLQRAGGTSNAFTSNDITNYYETIPVQNLETLMWLESDRMLSLAFTDKSLEVQRSVVIEEFKQRYINQPYGDVWHLLRDMVYKVHPYRWPTIGLEIAHIEEAMMEDVKAFFFKHYTPANGILCIGGDVKPDQTIELVEKWFGQIPHRAAYKRDLPQEPVQTEARLLEVERDVPQSMIVKAYHNVDRRHKDYPAADLISDLLSRGKSSRLHRSLVKEQKLFTEVHAYVSGELDPGTLMVNGMLRPGVSMEQADKAILAELEKLTNDGAGEKELEKVRNKFIAAKEFEDTSILSRAMNLCYYELLGDYAGAWNETDAYDKVTPDDIQRMCRQVLRPENASTLYYNAKQ